MLITLWAKAEESRRPDGLLNDPVAMEIIRQMDYDFTKFRHAAMSQVGCCIRARLIDEETRNYLTIHPDAVVIQLGAGLDARYQRLGLPRLTHWYDLDLDEAVAIRRRFIPDTDQCTSLPMSLFDYRWVDRVQQHGKPVLIIIEGVLMYFSREEVMGLFRELCRRFQQVTVLFDMLAFAAVKHARYHDALRKMSPKAEFRWSELETKTMEAWDEKIHVGREFYMSDHDDGRFPWPARMLYKVPFFHKRFNQRIVRLEIGPSGAGSCLTHQG